MNPFHGRSDRESTYSKAGLWANFLVLHTHDMHEKKAPEVHGKRNLESGTSGRLTTTGLEQPVWSYYWKEARPDKLLKFRALKIPHEYKAGPGGDFPRLRLAAVRISPVAQRRTLARGERKKV